MIIHSFKCIHFLHKKSPNLFLRGKRTMNVVAQNKKIFFQKGITNNASDFLLYSNHYYVICKDSKNLKQSLSLKKNSTSPLIKVASPSSNVDSTKKMDISSSGTSSSMMILTNGLLDLDNTAIPVWPRSFLVIQITRHANCQGYLTCQEA